MLGLYFSLPRTCVVYRLRFICAFFFFFSFLCLAFDLHSTCIVFMTFKFNWFFCLFLFKFYFRFKFICRFFSDCNRIWTHSHFLIVTVGSSECVCVFGQLVIWLWPATNCHVSTKKQNKTKYSDVMFGYVRMTTIARYLFCQTKSFHFNPIWSYRCTYEHTFFCFEPHAHTPQIH